MIVVKTLEHWLVTVHQLLLLLLVCVGFVTGIHKGIQLWKILEIYGNLKSVVKILEIFWI